MDQGAATNFKEMIYDHDNSLQELIKRQKKQISLYLQPNIVFAALKRDKIITDVQLQEISNIEKYGSREGAALYLLDTLIEENRAGWARTLYQSLCKENCTAITYMIKDFNKVDELKMYSDFLDLFYDDLVEVCPSDLYTYLHSNQCLSANDIDRLEKIEANELKIFNLLRTITKNQYWAAHFVEALRDCKSKAYRFIIDIEPKLEKVGSSLKEQFEKFARSQTEYDRGAVTRVQAVRPFIRVQPSTSAAASNSIQSTETMEVMPVIPIQQTSSSTNEAPEQPMEAMDMDEMEHTVAFSEEAPVNLSLRAEPTDFPSPSPKRRRFEEPQNKPTEYVPGSTNSDGKEKMISMVLGNGEKVTFADVGATGSRNQSTELISDSESPVDLRQSISSTPTPSSSDAINKMSPSIDNTDSLQAMMQETISTTSGPPIDSTDSLQVMVQEAISMTPALSNDVQSNIPTVAQDSIPSGSDNIETTEEGKDETVEEALSEEALDEFEDYTEDDIILKPFQRELAQPCIGGQNKLIIAPTNSGKTYVAMAITKHNLEKNKVLEKRKKKVIPKKVIFIVPKVCLAKQQRRQFANCLSKDGYKIFYMTGRGSSSYASDKIPIATMFKLFDVIVMTAQILVMGLERGDVTLQQISLLFFDECHNARGGNPMNSVLKHYMLQKFDNQKDLPQIVGLTASSGIGRSMQEEAIHAYILKLCARLDSTLHIVTKETESLKEHMKTQNKTNMRVHQRKSDGFHSVVSKMMETIIDKLKDTIPGMDDGSYNPLAQLSMAGTESYRRHIGNLKRDATEMKEKRRAFVACLEYLEVFNTALILNRDCEAVDAYKYIKLQMNTIKYNEASEKDPTEEWLESAFTDQLDNLKIIASSDKNPKLERLKEVVLKYTAGQENTQAMVMVTTRALTKALQRALNNDEDFKKENITVGRLVGTNADIHLGGQSDEEASQIVHLFKEGKIQVLVCTEVAREGFHIADCKLVVKYELTLNEIGERQATGRGRKDEAMIVTLGATDSQVFDRSVIVNAKLELMDEAIEKIHKMSNDQAMQKLHTFQEEIVKEEKERREKEAALPQKPMSAGEEYKLICARCERFVCYASEVRLFDNTNHVVVDPSFKERIKFKSLRHGRKPTWMGGYLYKKEKVFCKECPQDWGVAAATECGKAVYVLKQGGCFTVVLMEDEKKRSILFKWADLDFQFEAISFHELKKKAEMATN